MKTLLRVHNEFKDIIFLYSPPFSLDILEKLQIDCKKSYTYNENTGADCRKIKLLMQFMFPKKATKSQRNLSTDLLNSKFQINWEISSNFCGLLRKPEL